MIRSFFKYLFFNFALLFIFVFLFILYTKIILLNYYYFLYSFNKYDLHNKISALINKEAQNYLVSQTISKTEFNSLETNQMQALNDQVASYASFINEANMKEFLNTNVKYLLKYLNGTSQDLMIYLPLTHWGLEDEALSQIPDYLKTEQINVKTILEKQGVNDPNFQNVFARLKNTSLYVNIFLFFSFLAFIINSYIYTLFDNHNQKDRSFGKLITYTGTMTLIISWLFFISSNQLFSSTATIPSIEQEILSLLFPIYSKPLVYILSFFGLAQLIFGIIIFNKKSKNELVSKGKVR